jgi:hypothetical protein
MTDGSSPLRLSNSINDLRHSPMEARLAATASPNAMECSRLSCAFQHKDCLAFLASIAKKLDGLPLLVHELQLMKAAILEKQTRQAEEVSSHFIDLAANTNPALTYCTKGYTLRLSESRCLLFEGFFPLNRHASLTSFLFACYGEGIVRYNVGYDSSIILSKPSTSTPLLFYEDTSGGFWSLLRRQSTER